MGYDWCIVMGSCCSAGAVPALWGECTNGFTTPKKAFWKTLSPTGVAVHPRWYRPKGSNGKGFEAADARSRIHTMQTQMSSTTESHLQIRIVFQHDALTKTCGDGQVSPPDKQIYESKKWLRRQALTRWGGWVGLGRGLHRRRVPTASVSFPH